MSSIPDLFSLGARHCPGSDNQRQNHYHKKKDYVRVISHCSNLLFVAVMNPMTNSNLGRKGFVSSHRLRVVRQELQQRMAWSRTHGGMRLTG